MNSARSGARLLVAAETADSGVPRTPSQLLLSSYRDLGPTVAAPEHARNVVLSFVEYQAGLTGTYLRRQPAGPMRRLLHSESPADLPGFADPREVPSDQRSPRWTELCEGLDAFGSADLADQVALLGLCSALGYFAITAELGLDIADGMLGERHPFTDEQSTLFLLVAGAVVRTMPATSRSPLVGQLLGAVRQRAASGMRLFAHAHLVAYLSWSGSAGKAASEADALARELSDRAGGCVPAAILAYLACGLAIARRGDTALAREQLSRGWERIGDLDSGSDALAAQLRRSVAEARVALSFRCGDTEQALDEHQSIVRADPFDSQAWAERGALLDAIDPQAALASYRQALRLGPPVTEYALERLGDALARLGDLVGAYDAYASAAAAEGCRATALAKLARFAQEIGQPYVARWALARHDRCQVHDPPETPELGASVGTFPPSPVLVIADRRTERH